MSPCLSPPAPSGRSRRRLQWTLAALAAIPLASASREIVLGPQGVPGGSPDATPTVDSALRYANVFKFAVGPVIWSQLGRVERSPSLTYALSSHLRGRIHPSAVLAATGTAPPGTVGRSCSRSPHHRDEDTTEKLAERSSTDRQRE